MAQASTDPVVDFQFVNVNKVAPVTGSSGTFLSAGGNYVSVFALRGALQAFDAFTYTNNVLDMMSVNDMVFAYRNIADPTTISNYQPAQVARTA